VYNQLSGDVFVAPATLTAISGLIDALQLINADRVYRVTPKRFAASVTVKSNGLMRFEQNVCFAWTLIPNHLHLLLRTGFTPIATVMRRLLTGYAVTFNRRHRRHGQLFQNRYKSILCQEDLYLLELVR
jgi:hypothetical protein